MGTGSMPQGESCEGRKVPAPWKISLLVGISAWMEGEFQSLRRESSNKFVEGKMECPALLNLRHSSVSAGGG